VSERGPEFDELVGTDLEPAERERLLRVHELLVAVGPPPDLPPSLETPPIREPTRLVARRRRRIALVALAAALGLGVFAVGFLIGERGDEPGTFAVVAMTGTADAPRASASIEIFDADEAGNWPMEVSVSGLAPSASGRPYELWLTKDGQLAASCGSFLPEPDGTTVVPMNAPYKLREFDGWVVVEEGRTTPVLTTSATVSSFA
jgi:hypothetical protein